MPASTSRSAALTIAAGDREAVRIAAERFRVLVERSIVRVDERDLLAKISIGGTIAEVGDTAESVFERADAAMYRAKRGGRNRVELDPA